MSGDNWSWSDTAPGRTIMLVDGSGLVNVFQPPTVPGGAYGSQAGDFSTLVKLADVATIVPGVALWAFAGMIALFSALAASFSVRDFWAWIDALHCAPSDSSGG